MSSPIRNLMARKIALLTLIWSCSAVSLFAQKSGLDISLHANGHATAAEIGLPSYPGASPYKEPDNDAAFDLGYAFGDSHFRLMVANYVTTASPAQVLAFYRKPLSRYGDVLECNDGKPVGTPTTTRGGLTCSDQQGGHVQLNGHSDSTDHELRAGTSHQFRVVGIDKSQPNSTRFALVYVELPKDSDSNAKAK